MNRMHPRLWIVCVVAAYFCSPALAQIDPGLQGPTRWSEHAYGMSLTAPAGSTWVEQTDDGARVKFITQDPSTLSVYIRKSENELTLAAVKNKALNELAFLYPNVVTLEQDREPITVAGRDSMGLFLAVPDKEHGDWVFAQVYTLIDPTTLAIYQLDCNAPDYDKALETFKTMLDSVGFEDPKELDRIRTAQIEAGRVWLESLDKEMIKSALIDEQWLRITQGDKDVGYMRIRHHDEAEHVPPGNSVTVNSRIIDGPNTYDTEAKIFESDDKSTEFWTVTTTLRIPQTGAHHPDVIPQPDTRNWRQTGLRDGMAMEVSQETPTSIKKLPWKVPPFPYLSQADVYILPALFPRDKPTEMAFYSFHQNAQKLSLRTFRIEPLPGGSYRVFDRPTPDRTETVATYSPAGRLIERRMPDGRTYLATTPEELKRIWGTLGR